MRLSLHDECPSPEVSVNRILSYDVAIYELSIPTYIHLLVVVVVVVLEGGGAGTALEAYSYYGDKIGFGPCSNKLSICVKSGAVVRALASHQCGPGSNLDVGCVCCWFSSLL